MTTAADILTTLPRSQLLALDHTERHKYLIAYDVREPRRLQRTHTRLKDFGSPVQLSIFECLLNGAECERMWKAIREIIDESVDWVALYRLSRPYDEAIRNIGHYDATRLFEEDVIFI